MYRLLKAILSTNINLTKDFFSSCCVAIINMQTDGGDETQKPHNPPSSTTHARKSPSFA
jgi:hypothetical protein